MLAQNWLGKASQKFSRVHMQITPGVRFHLKARRAMKLTDKIKETAAAGYILLWLLGIPIPILFIIFLLRGCS